VEICKNRKLFPNDDLWRKRTRACIEATTSLVCCANAKLRWFGGITKLLGEIGGFEKIRELSLAGTDELFVMRWTCLSLVSIRPILADDLGVQSQARKTMWRFSEGDDTGNNDALATAREIDETLKKANICLTRLYWALWATEDLTVAEVKGILRSHEYTISELEIINIETIRPGWVDNWIFRMQNVIEDNSHQIISQFPGVFDNFDLNNQEPISFSRLIELSHNLCKLQFIHPRQALMSMCSISLTLRNVLDGQWDADAYKELLKNLKDFPSWQGDEMQRQVWRLQDLRDGGGLGFIVELFFLSLKQLLSTSSSKESHSTLCTGTFQVITTDWSKYKDSLGTQKLLLNIAMSRLREFNDDDYPAYIVEEFLVLLCNVFEGQAGSHIDEALAKLASTRPLGGVKFEDRLLKAITDVRAPPQSL
jgi:hypothetical protein